MKVISLTIKTRAAAIGFSILILGLGAIFLTLGMALLAGLAITGAVIGTGVAVYRRIKGKPHLVSGHRLTGESGLDPSLEVQPSRPAAMKPPRIPDK